MLGRLQHAPWGLKRGLSPLSSRPSAAGVKRNGWASAKQASNPLSSSDSSSSSLARSSVKTVGLVPSGRPLPARFKRGSAGGVSCSFGGPRVLGGPLGSVSMVVSSVPLGHLGRVHAVAEWTSLHPFLAQMCHPLLQLLPGSQSVHPLLML